MTDKKVGDSVELEAPSGFVGLPDGSVVSTSSSYTFKHPGEHTIEGETYSVADPSQPDPEPEPDPDPATSPEPAPAGTDTGSSGGSGEPVPF